MPTGSGPKSTPLLVSRQGIELSTHGLKVRCSFQSSSHRIYGAYGLESISPRLVADGVVFRRLKFTSLTAVRRSGN